MSDIENLIKKVESVWFDLLFHACAKQFEKTYLPSHDEWHHKRVWNYAKELIIKTQPAHVSEKDITGLMIAVFFHDQGMSETTSKMHGQKSREYCEHFFQTNHLHIPENFQTILESIEYHDKKDYSTTYDASIGFNLHKYLNVADDLDALGIIGAYRYLEIYLLRDIPLTEIPEAVLGNLESRFNHFTTNFPEQTELIEKHSARLSTIRLFYLDLAHQQKPAQVETEPQTGPLGVVNCIQKELLQKKIPLKIACHRILRNSNDDYITGFFERLINESL